MPSKQVINSDKSARAVVQAANTHASAIMAGIRPDLEPHLKKGEAMPDIELLIQLFARKLSADLEDLVKADRAHEKELADDAAPREARDAAAQKVRELLVDLRASVDSAFGLPGLKVLGLTSVTPSDPAGLQAQGDAVKEALLDPERKIGKPRRAGLSFNRKAFADELSPVLKELHDAIRLVRTEDREREATQLAKDKAFARYKETFTRYAWVIETFAEAARLPELAAKLRPSLRYPGVTVANEEPSAGDGDSSGGAPPPANG